jgi:hypothetical protein
VLRGGGRERDRRKRQSSRVSDRGTREVLPEKRTVFEDCGTEIVLLARVEACAAQKLLERGEGGERDARDGRALEEISERESPAESEADDRDEDANEDVGGHFLRRKA